MKQIAGSIENASILRKFSVLFLLMSILPTIVLYYIYFQIKQHGEVQLSESNLNLTLIFVMLGVMLGYATMRAVLKRIIDMVNTNKNALGDILTPEDLTKINNKGNNEVEALAESFRVITNRLSDNVRSLELAKEKLHSIMAKVGEGISTMDNIDSFLELILETVTDAMMGKVGVLMIVDEEKNELWVKAVCGMEYDPFEEIRIKIDDGTTIKSVIESRKPIVVPKLFFGKGCDSNHETLFAPPLVCAPLVSKDKVNGVITISGREISDNFGEDEINLLFNLTTQTAVAIENAKLNENIETTYFETISALALAVDAKDKYSRGHLERVANYCMMIAEKLGIDDDEKKILHNGASLHDLGKIGIPDDVLRKEGNLSDQEWVLMRKHPEIGESIIKPIQSLKNLCDIMRHHHEKLDGSGYPDGLKGEEITPLVRIIAVADIYDALVTDRPYRRKMSFEQAAKILRKMDESMDQDVVELFLEAMQEKLSYRLEK